MDLDPRRLLVLRAIAQTDSLAGAARRLGHTPSAVSQQLSKLEREAGVILVDRSPGRLELTAAGRILAAAGERIGDCLSAAEHELSLLTGTVSGPITLGVPAGGTVLLAAAAVPMLAKRHPALVPTVVEIEQEKGLQMLGAGGLDVMLITDDRDTAVPLPPGCAARVLTEDEYRVAIPDSWQRPTSPADLSGRPWIGAPASSARGRCFRRFADLHGIAPSAVHLATSPYTVEAMAAAGLGATVAPWFYADWLKNCTVLDFPVPGSFLARVLHRATPAAAAAADVVHECAMLRKEQLVQLGVHKRDILIRRLADPGDA